MVLLCQMDYCLVEAQPDVVASAYLCRMDYCRDEAQPDAVVERLDEVASALAMKTSTLDLSEKLSMASLAWAQQLALLPLPLRQ